MLGDVQHSGYFFVIGYCIICLVLFTKMCQIVPDTAGFFGHAGEDGEPVSLRKAVPVQHHQHRVPGGTLRCHVPQNKVSRAF